ncbi:serine protease inhibitor 42Dd-like [Anastrepha obliqua]|uniref:serine protease inhibitor 42Dd-like n=1 Tax=Anastrepha obliqua TaxID=95512 RepID=UPI00240A23A1|nr:serine protease inhibitor 42Dd-like [Anastrepha obliqua]
MSAIFSKLLEKLTNIIESPFLIWEILTMLRVGVTGDSGRELDEFLQQIATDIGISENDLAHLSRNDFLTSTTDDSNNHITPPLSSSDSNVLSSASEKSKKLWISNRLFIKSGCRLNENFTNVLKQQFACGVQELNFCDSRLAAKAINEWVKEATNKRIPAIISSHDVGADTQAVLANAIYFKAQWRQQFEPIDTKRKPFRIDTQQSVLVPLMSQVVNARYAYLADHKVQVLELPYRDTDLSMLVILPHEVAADLSGVTNLLLADVVGQLVFRKVYVKLPKFSYGCTINLHSLLTEFGVRGIFHGSQDFSSLIAANASDFGVSKIIQQAFINVTEEGTEAAAATTCSIDGVVSFEEKFIADRPFYFCIKNRSGLKLFEGCYRQPS